MREGTIRCLTRPTDEPLVLGRLYPGNFGVGQARQLLLIPLITAGRVEAWKLPDGLGGK